MKIKLSWPNVVAELFRALNPRSAAEAALEWMETKVFFL